MAPAILSPIVGLRFWWCTLRRPKRPWRRVVVVRVVRVVVWWVMLTDFGGGLIMVKVGGFLLEMLNAV